MKYLPQSHIKNIRLYYLLTIFMNGWFILPNWVFYYTQFIPIVQVGLIDGVSKLLAVILEVPSGTVSDVFGKKNTVILGNIFWAISCVVLIFSDSFVKLLVGNLLMFIGFAFVSGAKEALLYDTMIDNKLEADYDNVLGKVNSLAMSTTVFSIFAGGLLFGLDPRFTFGAWLVFSLVSVFILLFMTEPQNHEAETTYLEYFSRLKSGVTSVFNKPLITFILPVLFFSMLIKAYEGVIRQNTGAYFGFTGETFGYMLGIISIPSLIVSFNYHKIAKYFKANLDYLFGALYMVAFLIVYFSSNIFFGMVTFLSIYLAQEIAKPFIVSLVNKNTDSKHRATALSTVSLFSEFPYMIIVIFGGVLLEVNNIKYLYGVFFLSIVAYFVVTRSQQLLKTFGK